MKTFSSWSSYFFLVQIVLKIWQIEARRDIPITSSYYYKTWWLSFFRCHLLFQYVIFLGTSTIYKPISASLPWKINTFFDNSFINVKEIKGDYPAVIFRVSICVIHLGSSRSADTDQLYNGKKIPSLILFGFVCRWGKWPVEKVVFTSQRSHGGRWLQYISGM